MGKFDVQAQVNRIYNEFKNMRKARHDYESKIIKLLSNKNLHCYELCCRTGVETEIDSEKAYEILSRETSGWEMHERVTFRDSEQAVEFQKNEDEKRLEILEKTVVELKKKLGKD